MKLFRLYCVLLIVLVAVIAPGAAQDDEHPLLQMLALVPDTPGVRETLVSYADYRAMEAVRGIDTPTAADFEDRSDLSGLWIASSMGLSSGLPLHNLMLMLEGLEEATGFGFFDIDRSLTFGTPPGMGLVLGGNFDHESINAAFAARDFEATTQNDVTVLCGPNGCDSGTEMNLQDRNPANPFGGDFGRAEPLALLPGGLLANSANDDVLESMLAVREDEADSLADAEDYRAIVEAAADMGTVIQANFVSPMLLMLDPVSILGPRATAENIAALEEQLQAYNPLPPYTVAGLVDVGAGEDQIALVALAYADAEIAQAAAEEVVQRLQTGTSFVTNTPFTEVLQEREMTIDEPYVYESADTGLAIAMIPLRYPVPGNEPQDGSPTFSPSGLGYRFLINALMRRDTSFIGISME